MKDESDSTDAIAAVLVRAESAHAEYEAKELKGVYDAEWPRWYAAWALDNGLGELAGRRLSTDDLARLLAESYTAFKAANPKPAEPWSTFIARRIVEAG